MIANDSFETLVANLYGRVRRERVGNREYIVAPLTMLVPAVLNGSQGPLFYPPEEIQASTHFWEGMILTDDHLPDGVNGRHLSTQEQYSLGVIQNPVFNNGRLQAEGWFDVERTRRINPKILSALQSGQRIELSTGLTVTYDDTAGVHNGHPYRLIARNLRPDHLAVLLNQRGACNLNMGCGINNCDPNSPAGGALGRFPEIDWEAEARFPNQSQPPSQQQPLQPTYEPHEGPAGGTLGIPTIDWGQNY